MKKFLSIVLCLAMVLSMGTVAFAADTIPTGNYAAGTTVTYSDEATEAYTVTVPALLKPTAGSDSGTVSVAGKWASNRVVKVSADAKVTLTNSINSADTKDLAITFTPIAKAGSNTVEITGTEDDAKSTVSVATISNALFGTWSGTFNYTVGIEDVADEPLVAGAYFGDTFLTWEELQDKANENKYGYIDVAKISDTGIGNSAFHNSSGLTSIIISEGVTSIGDMAFAGVASLTSVTLPNSLTSIGADAFSGTGITSITIPANVTDMGKNAFLECSNLASVTISHGLNSIGEAAFKKCNNLTSVTLPNSLTSIGNDAFEYCSKLASVTIPDSVTSIGEFAFLGTGLTSITIPDGVTNIGFVAFNSCSSLTSVTYKGATYTSKSALTSALTGAGVTLGDSAFDETGLSN